MYDDDDNYLADLDLDPILDLKLNIDIEDLEIRFTEDGKFEIKEEIANHIRERIVDSGLPGPLYWAFQLAYVHEVYQHHLKQGGACWGRLEAVMHEHFEINDDDEVGAMLMIDTSKERVLH